MRKGSPAPLLPRIAGYTGKMNTRDRLRQFYLRFLLAVGMLWGGVPFLAAPLIHGGANFPVAVAAAAFNSFSLLVASFIGFWRRRIACVWLTFNALFLIASETISAASGRSLGVEELVGVAGSFAIALLLDVAEFQRWPGALEKQL